MSLIQPKTATYAALQHKTGLKMVSSSSLMDQSFFSGSGLYQPMQLPRTRNPKASFDRFHSMQVPSPKSIMAGQRNPREDAAFFMGALMGVGGTDPAEPQTKTWT